MFIGPGAILTNDRYPRAITSTGELARAADWEVSPIAVRYGSSIGAGAILVAGIEVGRFATVGAGAVVTRNVPNHALVAGSPARRIGWVCACGVAPRRCQRRPRPGRAGPICGAHGPPLRQLRPPLRLRPRCRDARGAVRPAPRSTSMIPIARPDLGPEETGGRRGGARQRDARPGTKPSPSSRSAGRSSSASGTRSRPPTARSRSWRSSRASASSRATR